MTEYSDSYVIFGGTFDPVHAGHIAALRYLLERFPLVIIAPTEQNPWKAEAATPLTLRREMLALVLQDENLLSVEISDRPYTYSRELVEHYRAERSGTLHWAIAEDLQDSISKWQGWTELAVPVEVVPIEIEASATEVREGSRQPHPALKGFIKQHGLYT